MPFGWKRDHEMEEGQGLLLNVNFEGLVPRITFYRNMISISV